MPRCTCSNNAQQNNPRGGEGTVCEPRILIWQCWFSGMDMLLSQDKFDSNGYGGSRGGGGVDDPLFCLKFTLKGWKTVFQTTKFSPWTPLASRTFGPHKFEPSFAKSWIHPRMGDNGREVALINFTCCPVWCPIFFLLFCLLRNIMCNKTGPTFGQLTWSTSCFFTEDFDLLYKHIPIQGKKNSPQNIIFPTFLMHFQPLTGLGYKKIPCGRTQRKIGWVSAYRRVN